MSRRAVVLLSGGLDSTTALFWAKRQGYRVTALTVDYGQRHLKELRSARQVARLAGVPLREVSLPLPWLKESALVDKKKSLPHSSLAKIARGGIPSTYVPGRNTIFLALGVSLADAEGASAVVIGANVLDASGYPDCRPAFLSAFARVAAAGTRQGAAGSPIKILSPLIALDKQGIIRLAMKVQAPLHLTWSCYQGAKRPCGLCDSCQLRTKGFRESGRPDPALH